MGDLPDIATPPGPSTVTPGQEPAPPSGHLSPDTTAAIQRRIAEMLVELEDMGCHSGVIAYGLENENIVYGSAAYGRIDAKGRLSNIARSCIKNHCTGKNARGERV